MWCIIVVVVFSNLLYLQSPVTVLCKSLPSQHAAAQAAMCIGYPTLLSLI